MTKTIVAVSMVEFIAGRLNFHSGMFIIEKIKAVQFGEHIGILAFHFCFSANH